MLRPRILRMAASERFKHERQHIRRNRGPPLWTASVTDSPFFVPGEGDGRASAMLYRVADQIRHHLGEAVGVPFAAQIPAGFQSHDGVRLAGTDLDHRLLAHLLKIGAASVQRN